MALDLTHSVGPRCVSPSGPKTALWTVVTTPRLWTTGGRRKRVRPLASATDQESVARGRCRNDLHRESTEEASPTEADPQSARTAFNSRSDIPNVRDERQYSQ